ncbi:MAG: 2-isopropylmalate synthase [Candidatus Margulisiibacteriota bacterium]|jgi:2-isopropylmalate synthase
MAMRKIKIFDTTLRDGEQSPGASMNTEEKLEVAKHLAKLNVDIIEAGFAISSPGDLEAIQAIARNVKGPYICSLARARKEDIDKAWEAVKPSAKPYIHTFLATSPIHMETKLRKTPDEVLKMAVEAVKYAKSLCEKVEFSAEDAGRSELPFLCRVIEEVIKAGATTVNIPDTVGYTSPYEFGELIKQIKARTPGIDKIDIAVHCHNDLGMATANSMAAVYNGANQVECTINGIGERAGNASLEEVVMILRTRKDYFQADTDIVTEHLYKTSRLVSGITGMPVQANKAIVGANAFSHEAGIHQDGVMKNKATYEIMDAKSIGWTDNLMVLGKHSGSHAFKQRLVEMGFDLSNEELAKAFEKFKVLADKKKDVSEQDLEQLVTDEVFIGTEIYSLKTVEASAGNTAKPKAKVCLIKDNQEICAEADGDGPVDAVYLAIDKLIGEKVKLLDYIIQAVTGGTDALGKVSVRIEDKGKPFTGRGADTDIIVSSAKAYINAVNKMLEARR